MHYYIQPIAQKLRSLADEQRAAGAKAYLKNQFSFIGLNMPDRRKICKEYMRSNPPLPVNELALLVKEFGQEDEREFQYFAIELLSYHKKSWNEEIIHLIEYCITHKSWWDTVDFIANECTGHYFELFSPQKKHITFKWNRSENIWLQRSSLLFQKKYKGDTDLQLLTDYIIHLAGSKEFFVKKGIGWVLREYGKTDSGWVKQFVKDNSLAPLSKREALKNLPE